MFLCFLQVRLFNERQKHFALTSSVAILKSEISSYAGISLASFDHQIKPKRSFFARTFEDQKSVQYKEKWAVHVFRNWQTAREKNHILLLWPGSVFKACKVLKKRLEDLHSLSLKFCLRKFFRTIERAFVQMSHSFVNWFPNTRVCIS